MRFGIQMMFNNSMMIRKLEHSYSLILFMTYLKFHKKHLMKNQGEEEGEEVFVETEESVVIEVEIEEGVVREV